MLLGRVYSRPEIRPVSERGLKAFRDLEEEGMVRIAHAGEAYQDPTAPPDEEDLVHDVQVYITPAGRQYHDQRWVREHQSLQAQKLVHRLERKTPRLLNPGERMLIHKRSNPAKRLTAAQRTMLAHDRG